MRHTGTTGHSEDAGPTVNSLGDMLMLCVSMLAAAATLLELLAWGRRAPAWRAVVRPAAAHLHPASWLPPAGTGRPPTWQFSVIRC